MQRLLTTLKDVTSEVFETMFFLFIEPLEDNGQASHGLPWRGPGIQSQVTLLGPHALTLGLTVSLDLSREMAANFLGQDSSDILIESQADVLKEVTNVIGGSFLLNIKGSAAYELQIPEVQFVTLENISIRAGRKTVWGEINGHLLEMFIKLAKTGVRAS